MPFETVQIQVSPEKQQKVIEAVGKVIKADRIFHQPIIGTREGHSGVVYLVYDCVENGQEVSAAATQNGAASSSIR